MNDRQKSHRGLRLFPRLALSYLGFAAAISLAFGLSLILAGLYATGGDLDGIIPDHLVDATGQLQSLEPIYRVGGWVEQLDQDFKVTQVHGDKQTPQMAYTPEDILGLTSPLRHDLDYFAFSYPDEPSGQHLLIYDRSDILIQSSFNISSTNNRSLARMFLLIFGLLFGLISLAMSYLLVRQIKRPIEAMRRGMRAVEAGQGEVRLDFKASPDLLELRDSFNRMSHELETRRTEKAELEEKKNRLLLELSHDLRTPIATIKSFATALSEDVVPESEKKRYYATICLKADKVTTLASDLFTMLRLSEADQPISQVPFDLSEYLRRLAAGFYPEIEASNKTLTLELPQEQLTLIADPSLLERALSNLLANAIKYNQTGQRIGLSAWTEDETVVIEVSDDGQAIASDEIDQLFDPFHRIDQTRRSSEGTGLGLSISRVITERHGGHLSYHYDAGLNRFQLRLPTT